MPEYSDERTLTIPAASSMASTPLPLSNVTQGMVLMPATWTAASIGFQVRDRSGAFYPLYSGGALVQIAAPAINQAYPIPALVFNANEVYLWSQNGVGVNANQAASRSIIVQIKE